ncbi:TetR/AcrR family transcriptional regulator [Phenylobacterium aquaticum]|uniref:TetR/AcrR family transcriptional regulator n=1 Tax=Phenylobacterium aquaticum TaxID=1763816 RepID=UPI001F5DA7CA|nr:TetR/AcrR family transcriptional regulator [Phenylobacterium aquaticum]
MPRLWNDTIETHRQAVRDATLDATAVLVAKYGLASVTMSKIAQATGIGRATLYKYFPDIEAILMAWHERQIGSHLDQLSRIRDQDGDVGARLKAVLMTFAMISHQRHDTDLGALLHRGDHVVRAHQRLRDLVGGLLAEGAASGALRSDIAPDELASYCLHALTAAGALPSKAAVSRLVEVTLDGLRPLARG